MDHFNLMCVSIRMKATIPTCRHESIRKDKMQETDNIVFVPKTTVTSWGRETLLCFLFRVTWPSVHLKTHQRVHQGVRLSLTVGGSFLPNLERKHSRSDQVEFTTPGKKSSNKITAVCPRESREVVFKGPVNAHDLWLLLVITKRMKADFQERLWSNYEDTK